MKRMMMMVALAALLVAALSMSAVIASAKQVQANAPEGCYKERGTLHCPEEGGPGKTGAEQDVTKKGSTSSSHATEEECTQGAGGSGNCPGGQFKGDNPLQ
jgi:hypothetical protein